MARSARNALVDQARAAERRWRREMRAADPAARIPRPRRPGTLTGTTTPTAGRIEDYQARVEIAQLIVRRLSGRRRLVAWRTLIDGWTTREIAEDLGLPSRTVRHLRTEAIRQIRAALSC